MKYQDIISKLSKGETLTTEEITFLQNTKPLDLDAVKDYLEKDENGKKYLQSQKDNAVTKGIETFKKGTMLELIDEEIKKKFPEETEEQKQLRKLQDDLKRIQDENKREKLLNKALSYATEKKLPTKFIDRLIDEDEEKTIGNIDAFGTFFNESVKSQVEEQFKSNGREPQAGNTNPKVDLRDIKEDDNWFAEREKEFNK